MAIVRDGIARGENYAVIARRLLAEANIVTSRTSVRRAAIKHGLVAP